MRPLFFLNSPSKVTQGRSSVPRSISRPSRQSLSLVISLEFVEFAALPALEMVLGRTMDGKGGNVDLETSGWPAGSADRNCTVAATCWDE